MSWGVGDDGGGDGIAGKLFSYCNYFPAAWMSFLAYSVLVAVVPYALSAFVWLDKTCTLSLTVLGLFDVEERSSLVAVVGAGPPLAWFNNRTGNGI